MCVFGSRRLGKLESDSLISVGISPVCILYFYVIFDLVIAFEIVQTDSSEKWPLVTYGKG